jgi:hypothetical protein
MYDHTLLIVGERNEHEGHGCGMPPTGRPSLQVDPGNALERRPERKKRNYKVSPTSCATTKRSTRVRRPFFDDPEAGRKLAVAQYRRKIVRRLQGEIS